MNSLLEIRDLWVRVGEKEILKGCNISIPEGEVHAIMGPNGSGKSTLAQVIAGNPVYEVTKGTILFKGQDLLLMKPDERANSGVFLSFQSPVELPGVGIAQFLKTALNQKRKFLGEKELDAVQFIKRLKMRSQALNVSDEMLKRFVNVGFSGGEKKKLEIFQMAFLEPSFCILDELDAGLDVDAIKTAAEGINIMREQNRSFLLITHFERLLTHVVPDKVHIMIDGRIVCSGDKSLARDLDENGYEKYR